MKEQLDEQSFGVGTCCANNPHSPGANCGLPIGHSGDHRNGTMSWSVVRVQVNSTGVLLCQCPDCGKRFTRTADLLALSIKDREVVTEILMRHFENAPPIIPNGASMTIGGLVEYLNLFSKKIPVRLQMVVDNPDGSGRIAVGGLHSILGPTADRPVVRLMATEDEP